jgi:nicotinate-nucleotide adenylyltransferase
VAVGILGGAFDPPHNGHAALAKRAVEHFGLERLLILVVADPGHKHVETSAEDRLALARLAFAELPECEVALDHHARTVDSLAALGLVDPVFLIGADELASFPDWKEPERVLELARLGVATRPGVPHDRLDAVVSQLSRPERVELFELEPLPISSSGLRERVARGEPIDQFVPPAVAAEIERRELYRPRAWVH